MELETFVTSDELLGYANKAIDECEQYIINNNQDLLLAITDFTLVSGQAAYDFPSDIYGQKLRKLYYINGDTNYTIKKAVGDQHLELTTGDYYKYRIINKAVEGYKLYLYPIPDESLTITNGFEYIRNAERLEDEDSVLDLPEAANFIIAYCKNECRKKELNDSSLADSNELVQARNNFIASIMPQTADEDSEDIPEIDLSIYEEMS